MATSEMWTLLENIESFLNAGILATDVSAKKVFLGLQNAPAQAANTEYPYIMLDDGGERTEVNESTRAQDRIYSVVFEMGTYSLVDLKTALKECLNLTEEVKQELEKEANRQLDGFIWGVAITPFGWESEQEFFRGRHVVVDFIHLEDTIDKY